jgi:hypothetical protein
MNWLSMVRVLMWAPFSGLAAWGSTVTSGAWSVVLAVLSAAFAVILVANLYSVLWVAPVFMRVVEIVHTAAGASTESPRMPRPLAWWYKRRGGWTDPPG